MPLALDIANDLVDVVDNLETVVLKRPGSTTVQTVPLALRSALDTREAAASNGKYTQDDVVWHIPVTVTINEVDSTVTPYVGGQVVTGLLDQYFTILSVTKATIKTRWRCVTRDLAIAAGTNQEVTILRKLTTRGTGGAAEYTETEEVKTGFKARIQTESVTPEVIDGRQSATVRANMYMAEAFDLDSRYIVRESDGKEWDVESYLAPEEIGQLPQAILTRTE